jgi:two-component system response regulator HydG
MHRRILIIDDDRSLCEILESELRRREFEVTSVTDPHEAIALFEREDFGLAITDVNMAGMNGVELCKQLVGRREDMPVIVITAYANMETAIAAIRAGAYDFITKPLDVDTLALTLDRAVQHRALRQEVKLLRRALADTRRLDDLIGASPPMERLRALLEQILDSDASVLITGESGTGKEVVARALHRRGRRKEGPFVAVNCAAMPESLLESELFGHTRGAFTDAREGRAGLFVQASGGTLLLDEIGDMPLAMQAKLLRALEERKVRPVGGASEVAFDVRLIAATNRDLETAIAEGRFREDLYFRVNVIGVALPPLRTRGGDVLLLAQHFLEDCATHAGKRVDGLSAVAAERLMSYAWPGNVRELRNCIERAVAVTRYSEIAVDDLPERIRDYRGSHVIVVAEDPSELLPMEEVERRYIEKVLAAVGGNKTMAAKVLAFDRKTLYNKIEKYHLDAAKAAPKPVDK